MDLAKQSHVDHGSKKSSRLSTWYYSEQYNSLCKDSVHSPSQSQLRNHDILLLQREINTALKRLLTKQKPNYASSKSSNVSESAIRYKQIKFIQIEKPEIEPPLIEYNMEYISNINEFSDTEINADFYDCVVEAGINDYERRKVTCDDQQVFAVTIDNDSQEYYPAAINNKITHNNRGVLPAVIDSKGTLSDLEIITALNNEITLNDQEFYPATINNVVTPNNEQLLPAAADDVVTRNVLKVFTAVNEYNGTDNLEIFTAAVDNNVTCTNDQEHYTEPMDIVPTQNYKQLFPAVPDNEMTRNNLNIFTSAIHNEGTSNELVVFSAAADIEMTHEDDEIFTASMHKEGSCNDLVDLSADVDNKVDDLSEQTSPWIYFEGCLDVIDTLWSKMMAFSYNALELNRQSKLKHKFT